MAYGIIDAAFWDDERITDRSIEARLIAAFLLTGRQATLVPGLVPLGMGGLSDAVRLTREKTEVAMHELIDCGFCQADWKANLIRIPNAPKYNPPHNGNVVRGWFRQWKSMPKCRLKYEHLESLMAAVSGAKLSVIEVWNTKFANRLVIDEASTVSVSISVFVSTDPDPDQANDPVRDATALRLWDLQERLRRECIPGSRPLSPTSEKLLRVHSVLEAGNTEADCEHVLRVYARDAKNNPESARWFNGTTNWRPDNFARALGRALPGPRRQLSLPEQYAAEEAARERGE